jgi:hypothetical protein
MGQIIGGMVDKTCYNDTASFTNCYLMKSSIFISATRA